MNLFWRVFLIIKIWFYVKITENLIFRHSLLIVFFVDMFCRLVFCKLQNMRRPSNVQRALTEGLVKMAKPPNIYGTHWHSVTKRALLLSKVPPPKNETQHKWHLAATLLVFWSTANILLIEPAPTIRHRRLYQE